MTGTHSSIMAFIDEINDTYPSITAFDSLMSPCVNPDACRKNTADIICAK